MENVLYYGDNLQILRRYVNDESVELIYPDPPFRGNQNYNVLFKEQGGPRPTSNRRPTDRLPRIYWRRSRSIVSERSIGTVMRNGSSVMNRPTGTCCGHTGPRGICRWENRRVRKKQNGTARSKDRGRPSLSTGSGVYGYA